MQAACPPPGVNADSLTACLQSLVRVVDVGERRLNKRVGVHVDELVSCYAVNARPLDGDCGIACLIANRQRTVGCQKGIAYKSLQPPCRYYFEDHSVFFNLAPGANLSCSKSFARNSRSRSRSEKYLSAVTPRPSASLKRPQFTIPVRKYTT